MHDNAPTTITIACGPDVGVNLILGLPFIKATKMVIDPADNIADCRALDCPPFPIEDKRARVEIPNVERPVTVSNAVYGGFIRDMEALEAHWACVYSTDLATGSKMNGMKKKRCADSLAPASADELVKKFLQDEMPEHSPARVSFGPEPNSVTDTYHDPALGADESGYTEE